MMKRRNKNIAVGVIILLTAAYSYLSQNGAGSQSRDNNSKNEPIGNYEEARRVFWKQLYNEGGETLYCARRFGSGYNKGINIEHVFPMGWVTHSLNCGTRKQCRDNNDLFNTIEADLHNLYPARSDINEERSSIAFGIVSGEKREYGSCDFEIRHNRPRQVEPRESVRGQIARAMLYMADTYDLLLYDKQRELMESWNLQFPPTKAEHQRNDQIEKIQGNRNSYIEEL